MAALSLVACELSGAGLLTDAVVPLGVADRGVVAAVAVGVLTGWGVELGLGAVLVDAVVVWLAGDGLLVALSPIKKFLMELNTLPLVVSEDSGAGATSESA